MSHSSRSRIFRTALALPVCGLLPWLAALSPARAVDYEWDVTSGLWDNASNWTNAGLFPPNAGEGDFFLQNGTGATPAETSVVGNPDGRFIHDLSIGEHNTLVLSGIALAGTAGSLRVTGNTVNQGLITSGLADTDFTRLELNWDFGGTGASTTNSGTIEAKQGVLYLNFHSSSGNLVNTGGLLVAKDGATLNLHGRTNGSGLQGGTLRSETGGTVEVGRYDVQPKTRLNNVTIDNQGTFLTIQSTTVTGGNRELYTALLGSSSFTNAGTTEVSRTGSAGTTGSAADYKVRFDVGGTSTFTNTGTLRVTNSSEHTTSDPSFQQGALFQISSTTASFSSTGTIEILHESTLAGTYSRFTSVQSITNQGLVHIRGNASGWGASFALTEPGNTYTQAGAGDRTLLENGGTISADSLVIQGGDFGGSGTVTGETTIGSAATLIAGDTLSGGPGTGLLTFEGDLVLADGSQVQFGLGADTASSGRIDLTGAYNLAVGDGVTVTITALDDFGAGTYRLFELATGTISGTNFTLNPLPEGWTGVLLGGVGENYVDLQVSAIPEPSSAWLLLIGVGLVWLCRRARSAEA